ERYCISKDADGHILSTSAPVLAQPMAKRIPLPLPHLDSENTDSIIAQVGRAKPNIPQSQQEENQKWRAWLQQPPSTAGKCRATELSHNLPEHHISPGISEMPEPTESPPASLPFTEESSPCPTRSSHPPTQQAALLPSSSDTSEILARYEELIRRIRESQRDEHQTYLAGNMSDAEIEQKQTPDGSLTTCPGHGRPKHPDAAEAWRIFVFGDENSDELESAAISQAAYDAAQTYRPFKRTQAMRNQHVSKQEIASKGRKWPCGPAGFRTPTEVSASVNSRPGSKSPDITTQVPGPELNVSPTESLANDMCLDEREPAGTFANPRGMAFQDKSSTVAAESGVEANKGKLMGQSQSRGTGTTGEQFRFAPPKLFVGSRSSNQHQRNINIIHATKKGRGRPKKRATDGRANIRTLPNYTSDPIEEFEEVEHSTQSLFPPLEFV
ncbi:hypothetical protein QBC42DRAFT_187490, partial [Cladorrhinum samala]